MTPTHHTWLLSAFSPLTWPRSTVSPSDYIAEHIQFSEPECTGPFSFAGREYLRDPIDDWGRDGVTDQVLVFATRMGKTRTIYAGLGYTVAHRSVRALYVKPKTHGTAGASDDARNRFIPMLRASPVLAALIPTGARRHDFKNLQQKLGGSIVDWSGSNSVAALASNPCQVVIQDEVDKFNATRKRDEQGNVAEADASSLADERTNECSTPKRIKVSTPTLASGTIWTKLLKTDLRRFHVPCPHCGELVIFAWSKEFTILPKTGKEAYVRWDQEAKRADGWDEQRVKETAHAECPHCHGKILDTHKGEMLRRGEWRPTQTGTPGHVGYHLPAMYGMHKASNFGETAVRFLAEVNSLKGPRGFINSMLAEPFEAQCSMGKRTELILSRLQVVNEWNRLASVDCQARAPYFWYVVRAHGTAESHGIAAGSCDTWDELRAVQLANRVNDAGVFIDSGWGTRDEADVYRNCVRYGEIVPMTVGMPICVGWNPTKGMPSRKRWKDQQTGLFLPYYLRPIDPFEGTEEAGRVKINLLEFAAEFFKDILASMRKGQAGYKWSVEDAVATEEYWRHMDGQHKVVERKFNGLTEVKWVPRHRDWPDHIFACEYLQVAAASFLQLLPMEQIIEK